MKLSVQTDYALRTLMFLAVRQKRATIEQIARHYSISANHVAKSANLLSRFEFVRSIRGIGGGIELRRPAAEITVGEVILAFEGNLHLLDCTHTEKVCSIQPTCKLKRVLSEAERIQIDYLNSVNIAEVIPDSDEKQTVTLSSKI